MTALGGVGNVYVQGGTGTAYTEIVFASGNDGEGDGEGDGDGGVTAISYYSSFKGIKGRDAKYFGGNTARAKVVGGFDLSNLSYGQISGFDISGEFDGIFSFNNDIIDINHNIYSGEFDYAYYPGIEVVNYNPGPATASITENMVNSTRGILIVTGNASELTVTNFDSNTVDGSEAGIEAKAFDDSRIQIDSMQNNFVNGVITTIGPVIVPDAQ